MQKLSDGLVEASTAVPAAERITCTVLEALSRALLSAGFGQSIFVLPEAVHVGERSDLRTFRLLNSNSVVQVSVDHDLFTHYDTDYYRVLERMIERLGDDYCFAEPTEQQTGEAQTLQLLEPGEHSLTRVGTAFVSVSGKLPAFSTEYSATRFFLDSVLVARSSLSFSVETAMKEGAARFYLTESGGCRYEIQLCKRSKELEMKVVQNSSMAEMAEEVYPINVQLGSIELAREDLIALRRGTRIALDCELPLRGLFVINGEHRLAEVSIHFEDGKPSVLVERLTFADGEE